MNYQSLIFDVNWWEPAAKANQQAVNHVERFMDFQMKAMQNYTDFGLARLKAASEINSLDDSRSFLEEQVQAAGTLSRMLLEDAQTLAQLTGEAQADLLEQWRASGEELVHRTQSSAEQMTQRAKQAAAKDKAAKDKAAKEKAA